MKRTIFCFLLFAGVCPAYAQNAAYKPATVRAPAQYLSTDAYAVEDTCPGHNIFQQFSCTKNEPAGYKCFDVYRVEGDPVDSERYTLLKQTVTEESVSADPQCSFDTLTCENFLQALHYNLDFSWYIDNFPSSAFPECADTYTCTRLSCLKPLPPAQDGSPRAQKLSCVFKKNQIFFLGTQITCQDKNAR